MGMCQHTLSNESPSVYNKSSSLCPEGRNDFFGNQGISSGAVARRNIENSSIFQQGPRKAGSFTKEKKERA